MLDAPEDMAGLSRNEDTREVARGNLVGVSGMASVEEDVGTRTDTIGRVQTCVEATKGRDQEEKLSGCDVMVWDGRNGAGNFGLP